MDKSEGWDPLFDGYYGMQNTGDDAFCAIAAWGARRYWGARQVRFATRRLPVIPESAGYPSPQAIFRGKPLCGDGYLYSLLTLIYRSVYLARSSGFVYAGGSTLLDIPYAKRLFQRIAHVLHRPIAGIGLSVGPFKTVRDRQAVTTFLQHLSFLSLRDSASVKETADMGLPYTPVRAFDLAGLLPEVYGPIPLRKKTGESYVLGVGLGHAGGYEAEKEQRICETLIQLVKRESVRVRFFIFNGYTRAACGDLCIAERIASLLKSFCPVEIVPYTEDPGQMWRRVAECDAFVAERLHAAIFAYMASVPFAFILYHRKCKDLAEDIGLPVGYRLSNAMPDPAVGTDILTELLHQPQFAELAVCDATAQAALNFTCAPWCV